jgi:GDP-mannose pyrophosphatase NudK
MTPQARMLGEKVLADGRFKLTRTRVEVTEAGGSRILDHEIYRHGGAAAVLLYDPGRGVVLLVRQFRLAAWLEGAAQPMTEVCAGMLDSDEPEACVIRESLEETGVAIASARHVFDAFVSPGASTEKIACFVAPYGARDRVGTGGGVDADERIAIIEPSLDEAMAMIGRGDICDAKTIALLYHAKAQGLLKSQ